MRMWSLAATALAGLALASCGAQTGPPATGAHSSAPDAVDQGTHGFTGGGANAFTPGQNSSGQNATTP